MPQSSALSSFSYNGNPVNSVGSVTVTLNRSPFEVSEIGDANAQFIAGYQNATAQLDVFYLQSDHTDLEAAINGASAAATAELTMQTGDTISGSAFVTSFSVTAAANDIVRASMTLQFTGTITISA
jgi:hypothetical protein